MPFRKVITLHWCFFVFLLYPIPTARISPVYLCARDSYRVEREDKAGLGFVDFIFYPENPADTGIILELKVDHTADEAVQQIIDKKYN